MFKPQRKKTPPGLVDPQVEFARLAREQRQGETNPARPPTPDELPVVDRDFCYHEDGD